MFRFDWKNETPVKPERLQNQLIFLFRGDIMTRINQVAENFGLEDRRGTGKFSSKGLQIFLLLLPGLIVFGLFTVYPIIKLFIISFFDWKIGLGQISQFIWFGNSPYVKELDIFEQNDLYMDKEQLPVKDLPKEILPLNKHWSWDRILRSCFIKQADVIQGIYFFPERFDIECIRRNFDFYEQRTVHESSLSPSVHSIVASWLDYREKAYELYLRTARLDLDNYNDDTEDGIHLTSMAGSWNTIIQGFAGIRTVCGKLTMRPYIPANWEEYSFKITFRGRKLKISISGNGITVGQMSGESLPIVIFDREYTSCADKHITIPIQ